MVKQLEDFGRLEFLRGFIEEFYPDYISPALLIPKRKSI
jgi:hypothetical protein